jgi:hypothetical protein
MSKPKKIEEPETLRQRVHCTKCPWSTQRVASEPPGKCNECGARCVGPKARGRVAIPKSLKRVRVVSFVLPQTLAWLGESPGPSAAEILDAAAAKR